MSAPALATRVIGELLTRTALDGAQVDDVIFGQGSPSSEASLIARVAAVGVGLPITAGGHQVDRRRGSGLQAVIDAAMQIHVGANSSSPAGSNAPPHTVDGHRGIGGAGLMLRDSLTRGRETAGGKFSPTPGGMVETAENLRRDYGRPREEQGELAVRSHRHAVAAQQLDTSPTRSSA